jgi:hypothetical protein
MIWKKTHSHAAVSGAMHVYDQQTQRIAAKQQKLEKARRVSSRAIRDHGLVETLGFKP